MWTQTEPKDLKFPKSPCKSCGKEVLVYRNLSSSEDFSYHCLDCDGLIPVEEIRDWNPSEMTDEGYRLEGQDLSEHKGSCGNCAKP